MLQTEIFRASDLSATGAFSNRLSSSTSEQTVAGTKGYEYDGGDFASFPTRKGWDMAMLKPDSFETYVLFWQQKSSEEAAVLAQSWLYFGMLGVFLDSHVTHTDFVADIGYGRRTLTLQQFPKYFNEQWISKLMERLDADDSSMIDYVDRCRSCLREASRFTLADDKGLLTFVPFAGDIALSVAVLGNTLESCIPGLEQDVNGSRSWGMGSVLRDRFLDVARGGLWPRCVNDIERLKNHVKVHALYYLSNLECPSGSIYSVQQRRFVQVDHSACTGTQCSAYNINESAYAQPHANCDECSVLGPDLKQLYAILEQDSPGLPLIRVVEGDYGSALRIEVVSHEPGMPFVAISHVWAEGLGNPHANTMNTCQVSRIAHSVARIRRSRRFWSHPERESLDPSDDQLLHVQYFWMDTFCIPRAKGKARQNALDMIQRPYKEATCVLVLQRDFNLLSADIRTQEECAAWILMSPWMTRLWTLEEGAVASKLLMEFRDGIWELDSLFEGVDYKAKSFLPYELASIQLIKGLREMVKFSKTSDQALKFTTVWNNAIGRAASVPGDESLLLAGMLDLDVASVRRTPVSGRSKKVYELAKVMPQQMLFSGLLKMTECGFRWADEQLLRWRFTQHGAIERPQEAPPCLIAMYPGYVISLDIVEGDSYFEDIFTGQWIKCTGMPLAGQRPRERDISAVIVQDLDWTLQVERSIPKRGVLVSFADGTLKTAREHKPRPQLAVLKDVFIERHVELSFVDAEDPALDAFRELHEDDALFGGNDPILPFEALQAQQILGGLWQIY